MQKKRLANHLFMVSIQWEKETSPENCSTYFFRCKGISLGQMKNILIDFFIHIDCYNFTVKTLAHEDLATVILTFDDFVEEINNFQTCYLENPDPCQISTIAKLFNFSSMIYNIKYDMYRKIKGHDNFCPKSIIGAFIKIRKYVLKDFANLVDNKITIHKKLFKIKEDSNKKNTDYLNYKTNIL